MSREEASRQAISDLYADVVGGVGLPASAGRIFAALLLSPTPLTQAQLRERLALSEGAVSEGLRMLVDRDYVERAGDPRARPARFQVHVAAWSASVTQTLASATATQALGRRLLQHFEEFGVGGPGYELVSRTQAVFDVLVAELPALCERALAAGEAAPASRPARDEAS